MVQAFSPDERCLGGVHEIHAEYANMRRKLLGAQSKVLFDDLMYTQRIVTNTSE